MQMPKAVHPYDVLLRPVVTEKSTMLAPLDKYVFAVHRWANKMQIKEAVEKAFDVHVMDVHVMNVRGKMKRFGKGTGLTPDWKKAIVTIAPGERIELFEGI
jgi:large subunit ribosomal protein L23